MSSTIILLVLTNIFFVVCLFIVITKKNKDYAERIIGINALVNETKSFRDQRLEKFKSSPTFSSLTEENLDTFWVRELEFYQSIGETICFPSEESVKEIPHHVTTLLEPYMEVSPPNNESNKSDIDEQLQTLEERYQQKIDENENLLKKLDEFKSTNNRNDEKSESDDSQQKILLQENLAKICQDISNLLGEELILEEAETPESLSEHYTKLHESLVNKFEQFNPEQGIDIVKQLRQEKIISVKKYRQSMALLYKVYHKYAQAFNLEVPENPEMEIEELESMVQLD